MLSLLKSTVILANLHIKLTLSVYHRLKKYSATFYDNEHNVVDDIEYHWGISDNDFDEKDLVLTTGDNFVKVTVKNNRDLVGKQFHLNVLSSVDTILASVVITITALW